MNVPLEIDIYRSAKLLVDQCGADAQRHAAMRMDALLAAGDVDGVTTWRGMMRALEELRREIPRSPSRNCALAAAR